MALDARVDDLRLTARERAALRYADRVWHDPHAVDDELWAELMKVFTPAEFIELATSIAMNIGMGKTMVVLGIPNPDFRDDSQQAPGSTGPPRR